MQQYAYIYTYIYLYEIFQLKFKSAKIYYLFHLKVCEKTPPPSPFTPSGDFEVGLPFIICRTCSSLIVVENWP